MKALCKIKRPDIESRFKELKACVLQPHYICRKCLRAASHKKMLCKPVDLD
jgi:hypothetical protein